MRPNNLLDESPIIVEVHRPDNATDINGELWFSSQNRLLKFNPSDENSEPQIVREFDEEISCMAGSSDGSFAIGFDNGTIVVGGTGQSNRDSSVGDEAFKCPTALTFINRQKLVVCQGSSTVKPSEMTRDLMQIGRTGSVWLLDISNRHRKLLAGDLGYPYGVVSLPGSDDILISE